MLSYLAALTSNARPRLEIAFCPREPWGAASPQVLVGKWNVRRASMTWQAYRMPKRCYQEFTTRRQNILSHAAYIWSSRVSAHCHFNHLKSLRQSWRERWKSKELGEATELACQSVSRVRHRWSSGVSVLHFDVGLSVLSRVQWFWHTKADCSLIWPKKTLVLHINI